MDLVLNRIMPLAYDLMVNPPSRACGNKGRTVCIAIIIVVRNELKSEVEAVAFDVHAKMMHYVIMSITTAATAEVIELRDSVILYKANIFSLDWEQRCIEDGYC